MVMMTMMIELLTVIKYLLSIMRNIYVKSLNPHTKSSHQLTMDAIHIIPFVYQRVIARTERLRKVSKDR